MSICGVELFHLKLTSRVGSGEEPCCNLMTLDSPDRSEAVAGTPRASDSGTGIREGG